MRTEDVLRSAHTGLWWWESARNVVIVDSVAARLLGFYDRVAEEAGAAGAAGEAGAAETAVDTRHVLSEPDLRSRIHVLDYVDLQGVVTRAATENALSETLLRIVDGGSSNGGSEDGDDNRGGVQRTVRVRLSPSREGGELTLSGTVAEVPEPAYADTSVTGEWRRNREAFLLDAGRELAEAGSTGEVLRVAASLAMPGFSPAGLAVFALEGEQLRLVSHHGYPSTPHTLDPFRELTVHSEHPAAEAVRSGRAVYLPDSDAYRHRFPRYWQFVEPLEREAWAFLPLLASGRCLGAWLAAFAYPVAFSPDERQVLTTVARMLAQALSRTSLHEAERELATTLQRTMRPLRKPDIPGMEAAARYVPTGGGLQVGGDWYDVIPLPSGRTALVIGDVQGHDVRAAAVMAQLRIALRAYAAEGHRPDGVLSRASRFLAGMRGGPEEEEEEEEEPRAGQGERAGQEEREEPGEREESRETARVVGASMGGFVDEFGASDEWSTAGDGDDRFATCLYVEVDPATGTLDIARAGHPDPAIWLPDGTLLVRPTAGGLPLGIAPGTDYPTTRLLLEPGETLLACTDGLIENGGHDLESGWARVRDVVRERTVREQTERREHPRAPGTEHGVHDIEELADALINAAHGPLAAPDRRGPLTDHREDDVALLLLTRVMPAGRVPPGAVTRRTILTVAQAEPDRIAEARNQLQVLLYDWTSEDQVDAAVLMLSEMLTNVLVHTDGDAVLVAECSGERGERLLRVEVADNSDALPHRRKPGELASSGRGLVLLEMLAGAWGVDPRGEGKSIWFELREDAPPPRWE